MKWRNFDEGEGYYHITGTITEWLPLLARDDIRRAVVYEIKLALKRYGATLAACVIMPDHLHLLVYLPSKPTCHHTSPRLLRHAPPRHYREICSGGAVW